MSQQLQLFVVPLVRRQQSTVDKEPQEYQMLVHLFGGASSPSCVNLTLKKTTEDNKAFDAVTFEAIKQNFYVDCFCPVAADSQAVHIAELLS